MLPEIGLLDLIAGFLIIASIFVVFMLWLVAPILPFLLIGAIYATVRYGIPAFERAVLATGSWAIYGVRRAATPLALWVLVPAGAEQRKRAER